MAYERGIAKAATWFINRVRSAFSLSPKGGVGKDEEEESKDITIFFPAPESSDSLLLVTLTGAETEKSSGMRIDSLVEDNRIINP